MQDMPKVPSQEHLGRMVQELELTQTDDGKYFIDDIKFAYGKASAVEEVNGKDFLEHVETQKKKYGL